MRWPLRPFLLLAVSLLGMILASTCQATEEDTRKDFERLAGQFQFFCDHDFLYGCAPVFTIPAAMLPEYQKRLDEVTASKHVTSALLALLKHKDPRVRTLAIAALFAKEDPKLLPRFVDMVGDTTVTFPVPQPELGGPPDFDRDKQLPPLVERRVGDLASAVVDHYMTRAGCNESFDPYWAARKDRAFCASWFGIQLDRARVCSPFATPEERVKRIHAVREKIDRLPKMDRAWTLLWLQPSREMDSDALASQEDLLAACKDLGSARLMAMLQRKMPSDDPDLQPRPQPHQNPDYTLGFVQDFVLRHAAAVLRREDAPALLDHGWEIAAASLQPEHAKEWLHAAMKRLTGEFDGDNRAAVAAALCRLVGPDETEFVVNWFYEQEPQRRYYPHCRAQFLVSVASLPDRGGHKFIAAIVRDKRLEKLDWQSWRTLIDVVNGWVDKPVVDPAMIDKRGFDQFRDDFYWLREQDRAKAPKETAALLKAFADWTAALRESIPKWGE